MSRDTSSKPPKSWTDKIHDARATVSRFCGSDALYVAQKRQLLKDEIDESLTNHKMDSSRIDPILNFLNLLRYFPTDDKGVEAWSKFMNDPAFKECLHGATQIRDYVILHEMAKIGRSKDPEAFAGLSPKYKQILDVLGTQHFLTTTSFKSEQTQEMVKKNAELFLDSQPGAVGGNLDVDSVQEDYDIAANTVRAAEAKAIQIDERRVSRLQKEHQSLAMGGHESRVGFIKDKIQSWPEFKYRAIFDEYMKGLITGGEFAKTIKADQANETGSKRNAPMEFLEPIRNWMHEIENYITLNNEECVTLEEECKPLKAQDQDRLTHEEKEKLNDLRVLRRRIQMDTEYHNFLTFKCFNVMKLMQSNTSEYGAPSLNPREVQPIARDFFFLKVQDGKVVRYAIPNAQTASLSFSPESFFASDIGRSGKVLSLPGFPNRNGTIIFPKARDTEKLFYEQFGPYGGLEGYETAIYREEAFRFKINAVELGKRTSAALCESFLQDTLDALNYALLKHKAKQPIPQVERFKGQDNQSLLDKCIVSVTSALGHTADQINIHSENPTLTIAAWSRARQAIRNRLKEMSDMSDIAQAGDMLAEVRDRNSNLKISDLFFTDDTRAAKYVEYLTSLGIDIQKDKDDTVEKFLSDIEKKIKDARESVKAVERTIHRTRLILDTVGNIDADVERAKLPGTTLYAQRAVKNLRKYQTNARQLKRSLRKSIQGAAHTVKPAPKPEIDGQEKEGVDSPNKTSAVSQTHYLSGVTHPLLQDIHYVRDYEAAHDADRSSSNHVHLDHPFSQSPRWNPNENRFKILLQKAVGIRKYIEKESRGDEKKKTAMQKEIGPIFMRFVRMYLTQNGFFSDNVINQSLQHSLEEVAKHAIWYDSEPISDSNPLKSIFEAGIKQSMFSSFGWKIDEFCKAYNKVFYFHSLCSVPKPKVITDIYTADAKHVPAEAEKDTGSKKEFKPPIDPDINLSSQVWNRLYAWLSQKMELQQKGCDIATPNIENKPVYIGLIESNIEKNLFSQFVDIPDHEGFFPSPSGKQWVKNFWVALLSATQNLDEVYYNLTKERPSLHPFDKETATVDTEKGKEQLRKALMDMSARMFRLSVWGSEFPRESSPSCFGCFGGDRKLRNEDIRMVNMCFVKTMKSLYPTDEEQAQDSRLRDKLEEIYKSAKKSQKDNSIVSSIRQGVKDAITKDGDTLKGILLKLYEEGVSRDKKFDGQDIVDVLSEDSQKITDSDKERINIYANNTADKMEQKLQAKLAEEDNKMPTKMNKEGKEFISGNQKYWEAITEVLVTYLVSTKMQEASKTDVGTWIGYVKELDENIERYNPGEPASSHETTRLKFSELAEPALGPQDTTLLGAMFTYGEGNKPIKLCQSTMLRNPEISIASL